MALYKGKTIISDNGSNIIIDSELSETSENPVQNKVITEKLNEINTHVATVNEVHNYSTEEHVVGVWTDGKPLYQKTIKMENITLTATSEYNIDISNLNIDVIASSPNGYIKYLTSMPLKSMRSIPLGLLGNYSISIDADRSNLMLKRKGGNIDISVIEITIQYTKTTDSPITPQTTLENAINNTTFSNLETQNKDLVGAINEVNKSNTYSTEEQVVGKWIDGKPVYRKTYTNLGISVTPANVWFDIVDVGELNIDTLINCYANPSKTTTMALNTLIDGTMLKGFFGTMWLLSTVTIKYTKTTD